MRPIKLVELQAVEKYDNFTSSNARHHVKYTSFTLFGFAIEL